MRSYLVTITMADGSKGEHYGLYPHGVDAVIAALERFPTACRISARRLAA
jgi:hypothetical protein